MSTLLHYLETVLATAQAGLTYSQDPFDIARFKHLQQVTSELIANHTDWTTSDIAAWIALDTHYPTPKMDVRAIILNDAAQVLLVQEAIDGLWTLPGGWCDIGESAAEAIVREVHEETGLQVEAVRLLALFDKHKHDHPPQMPHAFKAFFLCTAHAGSLQQQTDETLAAQYYFPDALPSLSLHRVLASQIQLLCERVQAGKTETVFD